MRADRPPQALPRLLLPLHSWGRGGPGGGDGGGGGDAKQMASQAGPASEAGLTVGSGLPHLDPISETRAVSLQPPVYFDPPKPWLTFRTPGGP